MTKAHIADKVVKDFFKLMRGDFVEITLKTYLIVCPLVFLAGFIDSVAGGGGIISLPAYIVAGLPVHFAYGTNKMANSFGTALATWEFAKSGYVRLKPALIAALGALIGGWIGSQIVLMLSAHTLQIMMMVLLPLVAVFMLTHKNMGSDVDNIVPKKKEYALSFIIGLATGCYDGVFGPGTGTFMLMSFTAFLGYAMITASANAKVANLASNVGALVSYVLGGKVLFAIAVPCLLCSCAGNYIGSKMAIKKGSRFIKPVIIVVITLLFIKIIVDFLLAQR